MSDNFLLNAALDYARQGYKVFPIYEPVDGGCSCRNVNCNKAGKHPQVKGGFKAASTDESKIRAWWRRHPHANIGIATGRSSNLFILDVDRKHGGEETLDSLLREAGDPFLDTRVVTTGGGFHYCFQCPSEEIKSGTAVLGDGIDIRCEGGYVVAPPSLHRNGERYQVFDPEVPIAPLPSWLLQRLLSTSAKRLIGVAETDLIPLGHRNAHLTSVAGKLRASGKGEPEILAALTLTNTGCAEPLCDSELAQIAHSISQYPPGREPLDLVPYNSSENPLYWFAFNTRNWLESHNVTCMSAEERGWYISLMVRAWSQEGRLSADPNTLARLAHADSAEHFGRNCNRVLSEFVLGEIDGEPWFIHRSLAAQYADKYSRWRQKQVAGLASAEKRRRTKNSEEVADE